MRKETERKYDCISADGAADRAGRQPDILADRPDPGAEPDHLTVKDIRQTVALCAGEICAAVARYDEGFDDVSDIMDDIRIATMWLIEQSFPEGGRLQTALMDLLGKETVGYNKRSHREWNRKR